MSKILIIPDLHGRDMWKQHVLQHENSVDKIIFLGDYLDSFTIDTETMINNLLDIVRYKEANLDKV